MKNVLLLGYKTLFQWYQIRPFMQFNRKHNDILFNGEIRNQRNMQTSNCSQNMRSIHSVWYLLAEYALGEMMPDNGKGDEPTAGFLFQPFQALGVPPEWIGKVEMTLTRVAKLAAVPAKQGGFERSGIIRVFCQKRMIDDANPAKSSRPDHAEPTMEPVTIKDPSGTMMNGGWGYFIIERSSDDAGASELVDLYLYQEGE